MCPIPKIVPPPTSIYHIPGNQNTWFCREILFLLFNSTNPTLSLLILPSNQFPNRVNCKCLWSPREEEQGLPFLQKRRNKKKNRGYILHAILLLSQMIRMGRYHCWENFITNYIMRIMKRSTNRK